MKTPLVQSPSVLLAGDSQRPIPAPYPTGRAVSRDGPDTAPVLRPQMPPLLCSPGGWARTGCQLHWDNCSGWRPLTGEVFGASTMQCHRAAACCQLLSSPACGNSPPCPHP